MMYDAEFMIYLWLLPVVLFVVIPLLMLPLGLMRNFFSTAKKTAASSETAELEEQERGYEKERREFPRIEARGVVAHISDGKNCCQGEVRDISQPGICLVSPSNILDKGAENLGVLVTGEGDRIQLLLKPKWKHHKGEQHHIGGEVADNLENWREFAVRYECA